MPTLQAGFVIAASFRLPGLGLLVVPAPPAPTWLVDYALHAAVAVTLLIEDQPLNPIIGTIEELARENQPAQRALLLDFAPDSVLPAGTRLQVV